MGDNEIQKGGNDKWEVLKFVEIAILNRKRWSLQAEVYVPKYFLTSSSSHVVFANYVCMRFSTCRAFETGIIFRKPGMIQLVSSDPLLETSSYDNTQVYISYIVHTR